MTSRHERKIPGFESRVGRLALLAPVCALVFATALAAPIAVDQDGLSLNAAQAGKGGNGNGRGGGNGNGNGPDGAPGQTKDKGGPASGGADPEASIGAEGSIGGSIDGGTELTNAVTPLIAEDLPPATVEVIREIAGLPEQSGLSEEEEMDAIRNGWGSWRTADGPADRAIQ